MAPYEPFSLSPDFHASGGGFSGLNNMSTGMPNMSAMAVCMPAEFRVPSMVAVTVGRETPRRRASSGWEIPVSLCMAFRMLGIGKSKCPQGIDSEKVSILFLFIHL